jgi:hypothetical protein
VVGGHPSGAISVKIRGIRTIGVVTAALLLAGAPATAQVLPAGPYSAFDGRLVLSGDVTGTAGAKDDHAFFNFTDYEHNALRLLRLGASGIWRPLDQVAFVGEVRSEDLEYPRTYAAYVRVRPWRAHAFSIQAGRIPPSFGAFARRTYTSSTALVGYPLAYQYLSSLRPDAIPAGPDDLLRMRGRGWLSRFPIGTPDADAGVPLVSAFRWDTGVQATWDGPLVAITGAVTNGTLSDPRVRDNNGGKQLSGRVALRPVAGLVLGVSGARGEWLSRDVVRLLPEDLASGHHPEIVWGVDAEYSRDHWIVQTELVAGRWTMPFSRPVHARQDVKALGAWIEGRYKFTPRVFVAARADRLDFSRITGTLFSGRPTPWDAPVSRIEAAVGYYLQRNLIARACVQRNQRENAGVRHRTFVSAQLSYWF